MTKKEYSPEILETLKKLRLMDDTFMACVFEDNIEAVTLVLHILLERDDLTVKAMTVQKWYTNLLGHSVRLDVVAEDTTGKLYDIEVQRASEGANPRRARYHSSMLDTRLLAKGEDYPTLKDSYVIFITEKDVLEEGRSLYHVERAVRESGKSFDDGSHIIYVNGEYDNKQDPVGRLMHDFRCEKAEDMNYSILAERVHYLKEQEGGQAAMCQVIEELNRKAAQEAAKRERERVALNLLERGLFSDDEIAEISLLTLEEVKALNTQRSA